MISVFLSKLLMSRQANFTEENISIFDLLFAMQPVESLVELQKAVEEKFGEKGTELMINFGRKISDAIIQHFKQRFGMKGEELRSLWLDMFSLSGFGKLEVVKFTPSSAIFQTDSSTIAKIYLNKYKQRKKSVCLIVSGMLESYLNEIMDKKAKCKETNCIATGKKYCTFELSF